MTDATFTIPARAHLGATRSAPHRAAPRRGASGSVLPPVVARLMRQAMRRPMRTGLYLLIVGVGALIALNALVWQTKRHPAPWGTTSERSQPAEAPPLPPARPAALDAARELGLDPRSAIRNAAPVAAPSPPAAIPAPPPAPARVVQREPVRDPARDPIADLIRGDSRPPADVKQAEGGKAAAKAARKPPSASARAD